MYSPRDNFTGESLLEDEYLGFIKELKAKEYEIALHNVGTDDFTRKECKVSIFIKTGFVMVGGAYG